jgi:hypothetical protein
MVSIGSCVVGVTGVSQSVGRALNCFCNQIKFTRSFALSRATYLSNERAGVELIHPTPESSAELDVERVVGHD